MVIYRQKGTTCLMRGLGDGERGKPRASEGNVARIRDPEVQDTPSPMQLLFKSQRGDKAQGNVIIASS